MANEVNRQVILRNFTLLHNKLSDKSATGCLNMQHIDTCATNLFGERISKREQLSNWEADVLNEKQKIYAATDAWACVMLYKEYLELSEKRDYELVIVPEQEPIKKEITENEDILKEG